VDLIAVLARRCEAGENDAKYAFFDWNTVTDFKLRFVGAAYKRLAWRFFHVPIMLQSAWRGAIESIVFDRTSEPPGPDAHSMKVLDVELQFARTGRMERGAK
jgi:hypothetical protein